MKTNTNKLRASVDGLVVELVVNYFGAIDSPCLRVKINSALVVKRIANL
jgi:hypothetical protein